MLGSVIVGHWTCDCKVVGSTSDRVEWLVLGWVTVDR